MPLKVSEEELEVELANRDTAIIIDFYATWCGPCLMLAKELEKVRQALQIFQLPTADFSVDR